MMNPVNSIMINEKDNVATTLVELHKGDTGRYLFHGEPVEIEIVEPIPRYHKYAICSIRENDQVRKYGEIIGRAVGSISAGAHVHDHNIISPGDDKE